VGTIAIAAELHTLLHRMIIAPFT